MIFQSNWKAQGKSWRCHRRDWWVKGVWN